MSNGSPQPGAEAERDGHRDFDVFRLHLGDAIALLAAFALLFIMAGDWYSTATGEAAREIVERQGTDEMGAGVFDDGAVEDARVEAEQAERNAWQVSSPLDLLVLAALLATIGLTLAAAALRAAGRQYPELSRSPTALAGAVALFTLVLLVVQAAVRLDADSEVTVRIGLPLAVASLGMIACGAGLALRERHGAEPPESSGSDSVAAPDAPAARQA